MTTATSEALRTQPRTLKNGNPAHELTPEERARGARKGGLAKAERQRELAKTFRERLAEEMNRRAEEIVTSLLDRLANEVEKTSLQELTAAFIRLADQAFGKPPQAVIGESNTPVRIVVQSAFPEPDDTV
jgi:hypothetical protein